MDYAMEHAEPEDYNLQAHILTCDNCEDYDTWIMLFCCLRCSQAIMCSRCCNRPLITHCEYENLVNVDEHALQVIFRRSLELPNDMGSPLTCPLCAKQGLSAVQLYNHWKRFHTLHPPEHLKVQCPICLRGNPRREWSDMPIYARNMMSHLEHHTRPPGTPAVLPPPRTDGIIIDPIAQDFHAVLLSIIKLPEPRGPIPTNEGANEGNTRNPRLDQMREEASLLCNQASYNINHYGQVDPPAQSDNPPPNAVVHSSLPVNNSSALVFENLYSRFSLSEPIAITRAIPCASNNWSSDSSDSSDSSERLLDLFKSDDKDDNESSKAFDPQIISFISAHMFESLKL